MKTRMSRRLFVEQLEQRNLFAASEPTSDEQLMLELINRARLDPVGELQRNLRVNDLNAGLPPGTISANPKQPVAFNLNLIDAARGHNRWMLATGTFSHTGQNGTSTIDRVAASGYGSPAAFLTGENLAFSGASGVPDVPDLVQKTHDDLFADAGHREILLDPKYREVGVAVDVGSFLNLNGVMTTHNYAVKGSTLFLTGVVYNDQVTADRFYTVGEGIGSITVSAKRQSDGAIVSTTTFGSGGYQIELAAGVYEVQFAGAGLPGTILQIVTIRDENVKVDLNTSQIPVLSLSVDNSVIQERGGLAKAMVTRRTSDLSAPLTVTFNSSRTSEATVPASVIIPANQTSATFDISAVDDSVVDLTQSSLITATAPSSVAASTTIQVIDDDGPSIWKNQRDAFDVNNDGTVAPLDVLLIINYIKRNGIGLAPNTQLVPPVFADTDGDWFISPIDVLLVINTLNRRSRGASEGEPQPDGMGGGLPTSEGACKGPFHWRPLFQNRFEMSLTAFNTKPNGTSEQQP